MPSGAPWECLSLDAGGKFLRNLLFILCVSCPPPPLYSLDHLHSSVPFPGAPPYLSNRAIWLGPYTTALHLYACHTCPDLFSTIWPYSPLVYSVVPSSSPQPSPLRLALGCHPQTLWPSHSQPSSTLRRPQLQAKPFLLLLTQKRSSHLSSQKEE